jgi:taurine dioxygenase
MRHRRFKASPLTRAIGAIIEGVDLSQPLDEEAFAEIKSALHEHLVIFFRDQTLTPEAHMAVASRFGRMEVHEVFPSLPEHPEISVLEHDAQRPPISDVWHSDVTYREQPSMASMLYARSIPPMGGDTLWLSAYAAFEALSASMQRFVTGLTAVHDFLKAYGTYFLKQERGRDRYRRAQEEMPPSTHPVVVTHPVTARDLLYVNPTFTSHIVELSAQESRAVLDMLYAHLLRPEFQLRFKWSVNDLAIWDNRATQHYATGDYYPEYRRMHRITVDGDRPIYRKARPSSVMR